MRPVVAALTGVAPHASPLARTLRRVVLRRSHGRYLRGNRYRRRSATTCRPTTSAPSVPKGVPHRARVPRDHPYRSAALMAVPHSTMTPSDRGPSRKSTPRARAHVGRCGLQARVALYATRRAGARGTDVPVAAVPAWSRSSADDRGLGVGPLHSSATPVGAVAGSPLSVIPDSGVGMRDQFRGGHPARFPDEKTYRAEEG